MHTVIANRVIDVSLNRVWAVLDDFGNIYKYNPGVKSSTLLSTTKSGIGAKRICHFYDGNSLKETITEYKDKQGYSFVLSDFKLPLKMAKTKILVRAKGENATQIQVVLSFQPKFGPLGWLMAKVLLKPALKKAMKGLTKGLDDHIRSGQIVSQNGELETT